MTLQSRSTQKLYPWASRLGGYLRWCEGMNAHAKTPERRVGSLPKMRPEFGQRLAIEGNLDMFLAARDAWGWRTRKFTGYQPRNKGVEPCEGRVVKYPTCSQCDHELNPELEDDCEKYYLVGRRNLLQVLASRIGCVIWVDDDPDVLADEAETTRKSMYGVKGYGKARSS